MWEGRSFAASPPAAWGRVAAGPSDRSLIDLYFDTGLVAAGLLPGRPNDKLGLGFVYSKYSDRVGGFDRDTISLAGANVPVRDFEANLELTYLVQVVPGWTVSRRHGDGTR